MDLLLLQSSHLCMWNPDFLLLWLRCTGSLSHDRGGTPSVLYTGVLTTLRTLRTALKVTSCTITCLCYFYLESLKSSFLLLLPTLNTKLGTGAWRGDTLFCL